MIPYDFDKALTTDRTSMSISGAQLDRVVSWCGVDMSPFSGLSASIGVSSSLCIF